MKNYARLLAIFPLMISGIGCKTLEKVHAPLECEGVPPLTIEFTAEEKQNTPESVLNKFFIRSNELQNRIKRDCRNVAAHNKQYED